MPQDGIERVLVVVADGLRADAVPLFGLDALARIADGGCASFTAQTVCPSVTAAAMSSLLTGVEPRVHGMESDRFAVPRPRAPLHPLPRHLQQHGVPSFAFLAGLPFGYGRLASHLAGMVGFSSTCFRGATSTEIVDAARPTLARQPRGFFLFHWPDADRAGHAHGWTSPQYALGARRMDESLGLLDLLTGASTAEDTLLIVLADHGGGGAEATDHDSGHHHDRTVPVVLAGGRVTRGRLNPGVSLLDVPATVSWALGVAPPPSYSGRALVESFVPAIPPRWRPPAIAAAA